jgi:hypothetical protein
MRNIYWRCKNGENSGTNLQKDEFTRIYPAAEDYKLRGLEGRNDS